MQTQTINTKHGELSGLLVDFTDRAGGQSRVLILAAEKLGGYRAVGAACDDLRGPLVKLWADGHLGRRHCAVTVHHAPLVQRGPCLRREPQGWGVGARVVSKVAAALPEAITPRLYVASGEVCRAAEIVAALRPTV